MKTVFTMIVNVRPPEAGLTAPPRTGHAAGDRRARSRPRSRVLAAARPTRHPFGSYRRRIRLVNIDACHRRRRARGRLPLLHRHRAPRRRRRHRDRDRRDPVAVDHVPRRRRRSSTRSSAWSCRRAASRWATSPTRACSAPTSSTSPDSRSRTRRATVEARQYDTEIPYGAQSGGRRARSALARRRGAPRVDARRPRVRRPRALRERPVARRLPQVGRHQRSPADDAEAAAVLRRCVRHRLRPRRRPRVLPPRRASSPWGRAASATRSSPRPPR